MFAAPDWSDRSNRRIFDGDGEADGGIWAGGKTQRKNLLERLLSVVCEVKPGEGVGRCCCA